MATRAVAVMLQCIFDGSISAYNMEIKRRPYHRNCSCALHKLKLEYTNACSQNKNISFTKKRSWNETSLSVDRSNLSSPYHFVSRTSVRNKARENRVPR
ncbi:capsid protein [Actinidia chinensis var. chinensis]|uniref:Capsid protein n=1 Tax=Actinidia chinensis var. chinensis TaxID=1590841 RepID=A0A2R6S1J0_ACTCC|nr:capsid protein [Actinidia chinensis var. chinensis]